MKLMMHTDKPLFKALNVTLLYAMLLNSFAPVYAARNSHSEGKRTEIIPSFSMNPSPSVAVADMAPLSDEQSEEATNAADQQNDQLSIVKSAEATALSVAVGGGPGQTESSGFSLGSTDGMVDKFTGDFSYSIPLADVEGYPIVLNYNSNVGMNSEASWVGLGWDLNVGSVSREMRGLPDEFNGEQTINRTFNQASDMTSGKKLGVFAGGGYELFGFFTPSVQLTALWGKYDNTYIGIGKTFDFSLGASVSITGEDGLFIAPSFGFGYSSDSKRGIGKGHSFGVAAGMESEVNNNYSVGLTFGKNSNSRLGLTERTVGLDVSKEFKNKGVELSYGTSTSVTYGTATMVPSTRFNSYSETKASGIELYAGQGNTGWNYRVGLKTQWTNTEVNRLTLGSGQVLRQPAIGYFHNGKRAAWEPASSVYTTALPLMDFNRANDYEFSQNMTNLPFSIQTYDVFRANANGLNATFRGRRHDIGTYYDPTTTSDNFVDGVNGKLGAIFPFPPAPPLIVKVEIGISDVSSTGDVTSGKLGANGGSGNALEFASEAKGNNFDSRIYFKGVGEMTPEDIDDFTSLGATEPVRFAMSEVSGEEIQLTTSMKGKQGFTGTANSSALNQVEDLVQATWYEPYTAEQYSTKRVYYGFYDVNDFPATGGNINQVMRNSNAVNNNANSKNHLSAVEVTNTSGIRYVFGIPAYDLLSSQVSFCATGITPAAGSGVCTFSAGDNTIGNTRGVSNYYDRTDVPAFAHSFLLTEMLSSDYIDRTNNGPTLDDVGSYFKFNYARAYGDAPGQQRYKWKFPMGINQAMFTQGMMGMTLDDVANYSYGEKEIWYVHSVESRNMVAEFYLSPRKDAYGVSGESGVLDPNTPLQKLDSIVIYNLSERTGPSGANAVPLQIIEFEYTYELCKNYPSNINTGTLPAESGKLTLTKIRSYTGSSTEMGLYTYEFKYDAVNNPNFSYDNADAWGNYKLSTAAKPNNLLPYPTQVETEANASAQSWRLIEVKTPTNGTLQVSYEADNYATVQDQRVMKHMDIKAMTNILEFNEIQAQSTWNIATSTKVYKTFSKNLSGYGGSITPLENYMDQFGKVDITHVPNNIIVFKLDEPVSDAMSKEDAGELVKKKYFIDTATHTTLRELYIKLHVNVKGSVQEFLPTFCRISNTWSTTPVIGVMPKLNVGSGYEYGYIIIDPALVEEESDHPVVINSLQRSALEFIRRNLQDVLYGSCPTCVPNTWLDKAVSKKGDDVNRAMADQGWGSEIITDYTSVRLYIPSNKKFGGGSRVKSLTYKDNWLAISGEYDGIYTWNYEYPARAKSLGNASFEPQTMIDECALYRWETYVNVAERFPDETRFTPTPITSLLFPTPVVGYEQVKTSISGTANLGYSLSEFHTSRTHPVIEDATQLDHSAETHRPHNLLTGKTTDRYGLSQGYVIHTNDFHGRQHQKMVYDIDEAENAQPILQTRETFHYVSGNNKISMSDRVGLIRPASVSLEYDMHADSRYVENSYMHEEIGLSLKVRILGAPPYVIPIPVPSYYRTSRTEGFYAHTFIKHLNTSAIVKRVETETLGSINSAENLVFDRYSGEVILSATKDEYDDSLFTLAYPAHWAYHELMDIASSKNNPVVTATLTADGGITTDVYNRLSPGDYVKITSIAGTPQVWIAKRNAWTSNQKLYLMKIDGMAYLPPAGTHTLQIVTTNRNNRLVETMQTVFSKKRPTFIQSSQEQIQMAPTEVISASAVGYNDRNNFQCFSTGPEKPGENKEVEVNKTTNPYLLGVRGDVVVESTYNWQSERINATHAYKTRFDGTYTSYTNFYRPDVNGVWRQISQTQHPDYSAYNAGSPKWRKQAQLLVFDQFGKPIEGRDQIQVRSAVLYGYDRSLNIVPVAKAVNARQQEIAFDGFEDYTYHKTFTNGWGITSPHFDFKSSAGGTIDSIQRHSGFYSLKVLTGNTASVTKAAGIVCDASSVNDSLVNRFRVLSCNCIKDFEPTPGDYIISGWVYNPDPALAADGIIQVAVTGLSTLTFFPSGPVLDGWQRVEGMFTVPSGAGVNVTVSLRNSGDYYPTYFDDIRIHPMLAGMTTVVYDPKTLLPVATHDGDNFTTFYNYDENLQQVRTRVETIEGIKTLSEVEMGGKKQPQ